MITLAPGNNIISNLVWEAALTNAVGSYNYTLIWSLAIKNKKGKFGDYQQFAETTHNFLITLGTPETNDLNNTATVKRMTYAVTVAKGAVDATTVANLVGPVATGGALFSEDNSIFSTPPDLDTAWDVMQTGIKRIVERCRL